MIWAASAVRPVAVDWRDQGQAAVMACTSKIISPGLPRTAAIAELPRSKA
jgi:hypothetical protein